MSAARNSRSISQAHINLIVILETFHVNICLKDKGMNNIPLMGINHLAQYTTIIIIIAFRSKSVQSLTAMQ